MKRLHGKSHTGLASGPPHLGHATPPGPTSTRQAPRPHSTRQQFRLPPGPDSTQPVAWKKHGFRRHLLRPGLLLATLAACSGPARLPVEAIAPPGAFQVGHGPYSVRLGDLDGDGRLETVTGNLRDESVSILYGGLPGHPVRRLDLPAAGSVPALALADMDGDGGLDIVAAVRSHPGHLAIYESFGPHRLLRSSHIPLPAPPNDIATGDLDGDGKPEVVVALRGAGLAFYGFAGATGTPFVEEQPLGGCRGAWDYGPDGVLLADLNDDGYLDLAVACQDSWSLMVLMGTGQGLPGPPRTVASMAAEVEEKLARMDPARRKALDYPFCGLRKVRSGDLDGDGQMDLLAIGDCGDLLAVFGVATAAPEVISLMTGLEGTNNLALADLDNDGALEVVITSGHERTALILEAGNIRGRQVTIRRSASLPRTPESLVLQDLDADGRMDLVVAGEYAAAVEFLRGDGTGAFAPFPAPAARVPPSTASR